MWSRTVRSTSNRRRCTVAAARPDSGPKLTKRVRAGDKPVAAGAGHRHQSVLDGGGLRQRVLVALEPLVPRDEEHHRLCAAGAQPRGQAARDVVLGHAGCEPGQHVGEHPARVRAERPVAVDFGGQQGYAERPEVFDLEAAARRVRQDLARAEQVLQRRRFGLGVVPRCVDEVDAFGQFFGLEPTPFNA